MRQTLIIIVTHACNLYCKFCPLFRSQNYIDSNIAQRAIHVFLQKAKKNEVRRIRFFGGEPLLRFALIRDCMEYAIKEADKAGIKVEFDIATNASLLDDQMLEYFISCVSLEIAINSYTSGNWNRTLFPRFFRLPAGTINLLIHPDNLTSFRNETQNFVSQGFRRINFLPAYYIVWSDDHLDALRQELKRLIPFARSQVESNKLYIKNLHQQDDVPLYNSGLVVDCDGDLYPTNLILSSSFLALKPALRIGNICDKDIADAITDSNTDVRPCLEKYLSPAILASTYSVDDIFSEFLHAVKKGKA